MSEIESFVSTDADESTSPDSERPAFEDFDRTLESAPQVAEIQPDAASGSIHDPSGDEGPTRNYDNWPAPVALIDRLAQFQRHELGRAWADEVRSLVDQLAELRIDDAAAMELLGGLRVLTQQASSGQSKLRAADERDLEQLQLDLLRRVDLWEKAAQATGSELVSLRAIDADSAMQQALAKTAALLAKAPVGDTWHNYLMLARLNELARDVSDDAMAERQRTARIVLARLADPRLTSSAEAGHCRAAAGGAQTTPEPLDRRTTPPRRVAIHRRGLRAGAGYFARPDAGGAVGAVAPLCAMPPKSAWAASLPGSIAMQTCGL